MTDEEPEAKGNDAASTKEEGFVEVKNSRNRQPRNQATHQELDPDQPPPPKKKRQHFSGSKRSRFRLGPRPRSHSERS